MTASGRWSESVGEIYVIRQIALRDEVRGIILPPQRSHDRHPGRDGPGGDKSKAQPAAQPAASRKR